MTTEARSPLAVVRVYHDEIFSLVSDLTIDGKTYESLGQYQVTGRDGTEEVRNKIQQTLPGAYTEVQISPDVTGTPTEFTHMAEFLLDRHAPGEHVTGLFCVDGDKKVAQRLAAVMGVDFLTKEPKAPAPAPASDAQEG